MLLVLARGETVLLLRLVVLVLADVVPKGVGNKRLHVRLLDQFGESG